MSKEFLHLFSGARRKVGIAEAFAAVSKECGAPAVVVHADVAKVSRRRMALYMQAAQAGRWAGIVAAVPCKTFARAAWSHGRGPRAMRDAEHPMGFPWLRGGGLASTRRENTLLTAIVQLVLASGAADPGAKYVLAGPEALGATRAGGKPAAVWQHEAFDDIRKLGGFRQGAVALGDFGAELQRPTRVYTNTPSLKLADGPPTYDTEGFYSGPIKLKDDARPGQRPPGQLSTAWPAKWAREVARAMLDTGGASASGERGSREGSATQVATSTTQMAITTRVASAAAVGGGAPAKRHVALIEQRRRKLTEGDWARLRGGLFNPRAEVYIGRGGKGVEASAWANPFKIGPDGTREEVIDKFRRYLRDAPVLKRVMDLEGKVLVCHCGPAEACHGDVLLEALDAAASADLLADDGLPLRIGGLEHQEESPPTAPATTAPTSTTAASTSTAAGTGRTSAASRAMATSGGSEPCGSSARTTAAARSRGVVSMSEPVGSSAECARDGSASRDAGSMSESVGSSAEKAASRGAVSMSESVGSSAEKGLGRGAVSMSESIGASAEKVVGSRAAGWRGRGQPRGARCMGQDRPFADGGGLCSPGRWPLGKRVFPSQGKVLREELLGVFRGFLGRQEKVCDCELWTLHLAAGRFKECPFDEAAIEEARAVFTARLGPHEQPQPHKIDFPLIRSLLAMLGDPDTEVFKDFEVGVNLGVTEPLPRTPWVYEQKTRWNLDEPGGSQEWEVPNYKSVHGHESAVRDLFAEEAALGWMEEVTDEEARRRYGQNLRIAALGVVQEPTKIRVVHDGSNRVEVNNAIRPNDQQRCPGAAELRTILAERRAVGLKGFAVVGDISKAHRRIPVREADWGFQACRLEPGKVWLNRVGTYGMGSAAYWWSRFAAAAVVRLSYYLVGQGSLLDVLIYVDDLLLVAGQREDLVSIAVLLLAFAALRVPFGWKKFRGGSETQWIGYTIDLMSYTVGISKKRADWLANWMEVRVREKTVDLADFAAVLGRLGFTLGPLEYVRPFVAPLYAWSAAVGHRGIVPIPWSVAFLLTILARRFRSKDRVASVYPRASSLGTAFRADAKAQGASVCVGGWECLRGRRPSEARWFSVELTKTTAPWAFSRGEPFRTIASLELFATLLCVVAFGDQWPRGAGGSIMLQGITDNQGNQAVMSRLMTSKFPLVVILVELAAQLEDRNIDLALDWVPRDQNEPADALSNGDFAMFDEKRRVHIDLSQTKWLLLPEVLKVSAGLYQDIQTAKARRKLDGPRAPARRIPAGGRLRDRDPW